MKRFRDWLGVVPVAATCLALSGTNAGAQETIRLKVATFLPGQHFQVENGSNVWMEEVTKATNGRVQFEFFPAEQLGKAAELLDLVQSGVIDIGEVPPAYVTEKLPLVGVLEMPGLASSSCQAAEAFRQLVEPGGTIYEDDYKPNQVRPLASFIYPPYKVINATRKVEDIDDFSGLKLRTSGGAMQLVAETLGAIPVQMSSPEIYQSLSRGTIDGVFFTFLSGKAQDMQTVTDHASVGYGFGVTSVVMTISERTWNELPQDVQQAMLEAGPVAETSYCTFVDENEAKERAFFEEQGMEITEFSDEVIDNLDETLSVVATTWAESLDARGEPGSKALEEFRAALKDETSQ